MIWSLERRRAEFASEHQRAATKKLQRENAANSWNSERASRHFNTLKRAGVCILAVFGSTYSCEQSFSHPKNENNSAKGGHFWQMTASKPSLKLDVTTYKSDFKAISNIRQHLKSH